ncbi:Filensin [Liparis tanakae]|uniref:Filensin n=1 Tax=Liparis tanakae TaxID=230148 RepID=A0A4Z2IMT9_9TELE|nr:Filensin [Liparis tanakae]
MEEVLISISSTVLLGAYVDLQRISTIFFSLTGKINADRRRKHDVVLTGGAREAGEEGDRALRGDHQPTGGKRTTMYKTSYLREVREEKYERSDVFNKEPVDFESSAGISAIQGWESLQELNSRFDRYINRARVLEQRNAVFRKQLETLQRMEEASGLEEALTEQTEVNGQRIREMNSDRAKLERELKDACRMLDEFSSK